MEARLRESEARYRLMFEKMSNGFSLAEVVCDPQGRPVDFRFLAVNPAFERMIHTETQPLIGRMASEILPAFQKQELIEALGRVALTGEPTHFDYHLPLFDRYLDITAYSPKARQFTMIVEDITDRRQAEQSFERSLRRLTILRNIDLVITTQTDLTVMANIILTQITKLSEVDGAVLFVPNPADARSKRLSTGELKSGSAFLEVAQSGMPNRHLPVEAQFFQQELVQQAYRSVEPIYIDDTSEEGKSGSRRLLEVTGFCSCATLPLVARGFVKGALQFFRAQYSALDSDWQPFSQSLALQMAIAIDNVDMFDDLKRTNRELSRAYDETIRGWAQALELRGVDETHGHTDRVTGLAERLGRAMGMSEDALEHFRRGVLLHDIGKMAVPEIILRKPGPLTPDEWVIMRQHVVYGYQFLSKIEYLRPALDVVYYHHEKWDGTGYPARLIGDNIPLVARIFSVVDVYDALTNERVYRPAWPKSDALAYIRENSGCHFDPQVVEAFLGLIE